MMLPAMADLGAITVVWSSEEFEKGWGLLPTFTLSAFQTSWLGLVAHNCNATI